MLQNLENASPNMLFFTEPSWEFYKESQSKDFSVIDVDLTNRIGLDFVTAENLEAYKGTEDMEYRRSYTRFVFTINLEAQEKDGLLMTIIPSVKYTKEYQDKISNNTYLHRGANIDGSILFHHIDGAYMSGWVYEKGQVIKPIDFRETPIGVVVAQYKVQRVHFNNGAFLTIETNENIIFTSSELAIQRRICESDLPESLTSQLKEQFINFCLDLYKDGGKYTYIPSNYRKNEINAYNAQLDGAKRGWYILSTAEQQKTQDAITQYIASYNRAQDYERKKGLNPDGSTK